MERLLDNHNNKLLEKDVQKKKKCNYRIKEECTLDGNCLIKDIVYKAKITNKDEIKFYIGVAKGD